MPVSYAQGFAFVHIPRTGGQAVLRALEVADPAMDLHGFGIWDILCQHPESHWLAMQVRKVYPINSLAGFAQQHLPAVVVRSLVGPKAWEKLFTFSFVRNPWDWLVSRYHHQKRELAAITRMEPDKAALLERCSTFQEFVKFSVVNEIPSMASMISNARGKVIVDFVGRFENLQRDFKFLEKKTCADLPDLTRVDATNHGHYREYYTGETRDLVARLFAKDIDLFGYEF